MFCYGVLECVMGQGKLKSELVVVWCFNADPQITFPISSEIMSYDVTLQRHAQYSKPGNICLNSFTNLYYVSIIDHTGPLESLRTLVGSQRQLLRVEFYHFQNKSPYSSLARRRSLILCCVANCRTQVVGNFS